MIKPLILAAALLVPAAALAAPVEQRFTRDGETYTYTVSYDQAGRTVIDGIAASRSTSFRYVVDGRSVEGWTGSQRVSFRVAKPLPRTTAPTGTVVAGK